jgi:hypothetical protein
MVVMLEVEAEGEMGGLLEEDVTDRAVDNVVDGRALTQSAQSVSVTGWSKHR